MEFYQEETNKLRRMIVWLVDIIVVISLAWFVVYGFGTQIRITGQSMTPELRSEDVVLMNRLSYDLGSPKRFDVVVFEREDKKPNVKRVIGLPGETVSFVGGKVYINGEPLDESAYLDDTVETDCGEEDKTFTVPEGSYFMLGDNREISLDARYWKHTYITTDDMKSKEILIIPFHRLPWF